MSLSKTLGVESARHKIVPWHPSHYNLIALNKFDLEIRRKFPEYSETFEAYAQSGQAYTGIGDGKVYCMFGAYEYWPGVSEAWLIPSRDLSEKTMTFHRAALKFFSHYMKSTRTRRLQITVSTLNVQAVKWTERCYFTHEGTLRKFGIEGADYEMFARIAK